MRTKNVIIRADGSKEVGMGHLKRATLLGEYLSSMGCRVNLFSSHDPAAVSFLGENTHFSISWIEGPNTQQEFDAFRRVAENHGPIDVVICDLLDVDDQQPYLVMLREKCKKFVRIVDNSERREHFGDLVINGNPSHNNSSETDLSSGRLYGPKYFIMSGDYGKLHKKDIREECESAVVCMGGVDQDNLVFKVIEALAGSSLSIQVISSKGTGYYDRLVQALDDSSLTYGLRLDVECLLPYFLDADFAITAGGNTLFERIASGLPGITLCQLKRQNQIADKFEAMDVNTNAGMGVDASTQDLADCIHDFRHSYQKRKKQHETSRSVIDGRGLERVANHITS
jgi:spore coat polysaccharide biosynthesis predicted glycosyltransferase SpsG